MCLIQNTKFDWPFITTNNCTDEVFHNKPSVYHGTNLTTLFQKCPIMHVQWRLVAFVVYQYFWETFVIGVRWRLLAFSGVCWRAVAFVGVQWRSVACSGVCCLPIFLGDICYWRLLAFGGVCWHSVAFVGVCWRSVAFVGVCLLVRPISPYKGKDNLQSYQIFISILHSWH